MLLIFLSKMEKRTPEEFGEAAERKAVGLPESRARTTLRAPPRAVAVLESAAYLRWITKDEEYPLGAPYFFIKNGDENSYKEKSFLAIIVIMCIILIYC